MYEEINRQKYEEFKLNAQIHGATFKDEPQEITTEFGQKKKVDKSFVFGDPNQYDDLTQEERDELTDKMINQHKAWAKGVKLKG